MAAKRNVNRPTTWKHWTPLEDEILAEAHLYGVNLHIAADILGRSYNAVCGRTLVLGLSKNIRARVNKPYRSLTLSVSDEFYFRFRTHAREHRYNYGLFVEQVMTAFLNQLESVNESSIEAEYQMAAE